MIDFKNLFNNKKFKPQERLWLFCMLTFICGFFGGYTFAGRGHLFVNAQTGNLVILSTGLGQINSDIIIFSIILLIVYSLGLGLGEIFKKIFRKPYLWENILLIILLLTTVILGFFGADLAIEFTLFPIAFLVAMMYSTFEKAHGLGMATGFCTNHLKQTVVNFIRYARDDDNEKLVVSLSHFFMIVSFVGGASLAVILSEIFSAKSIWFSTFLLVFTLILFNISIKNEKNSI